MTGGFCVHCGAPQRESASFCTVCGGALARASAEPVPSPAEPGERSQPDLAEVDKPPVTVHAVGPTDAAYRKTIVAEDEADTAAGSVSYPAPLPTVIDEPEPQSARVSLHVSDVESGQTILEFEVDEHRSLVVGRDGAVANYVPDDPRASRRHFRVSLSANGFLLEDLGSSNGTYLNGVRIHEPHIIGDGDTIEYGRSSAVFHVLNDPDHWPSV